MYTNFDDLPLVLTVENVSEVLDISTNTAYELLRSGKLRCVKVGRQYRIPKTAILEYLAA